MKTIILASSLASTAAFVTPSVPVSRGTTLTMMEEERSTALPFDKRPPGLDGSLVGDVGFDPVGFSNNPPRPWLIGGEGRSLKWYREAELAHGRVAMLATLGMIFPSFYHLPGNEAVGVDAFAKTGPYDALNSVPKDGLLQISLTLGFIELYRIRRCIRGDKPAGDLNLGQFGDINPFGLNYDEEEYEKMQLREIKHCRLAMVGALGMLIQAGITGKNVVEQLSGAFEFPEAVGKAGYYFPDGI